MSYGKLKEYLQNELHGITENGLLKVEQQIISPQGSNIQTTDGNTINFCANNYLGLANHPDIVATAHQALDTYGYGMASVRFICGTQQQHKNLERQIANFLQTDDTILYSSCFDANGGLFETLLGPEDAIISASLNHASIIDGVRLCKAQRFVYKYDDMTDLEIQLQKAASARFRLIATDGVFSMHGDLAPLNQVCDLADQYDALVMVDDSHATGFLGPNGRGTPEHYGVLDRIDIITSTLGKALGGASGGFTTGRQEIIDFLRQRSRPYLFSNTLAPAITAASIKALELVQENPSLRETLFANTRYFREQMTTRGFQIKEGIHPIVPIMLGDEKRTVEMAQKVNERGIFAVGFSYPVVPKGEARIRVQISAAHTIEQLDKAIAVFEETGKSVGVI
ncbi:MAG: glycine C-acetyltransferase [Candidatus Latescibacteria bacterium]|jgi:glycine C-acetyltransferase|nr:glycine C-acetyltransferase [Candidatus Latescibacterota bacterium]MBT4140783.1 glycine C-acetyltransferase [Candidatus Latescibacterota bacterium]